MGLTGDRQQRLQWEIGFQKSFAEEKNREENNVFYVCANFFPIFIFTVSVAPPFPRLGERMYQALQRQELSLEREAFQD